jgi:threonine/homoserine/homoserine lactone efflux protein
MPFDTWLAFAGASAALLVIPGPTVTVVVSYALSQGRRAALPLAAGVALGDLAAMTVSLAGLGAVFIASPAAFAALKWLGAAYLAWLGFKLWRAAAAAAGGRAPEPAMRLFVHAWTVTALNPSGFTFFVAFLPQFLVAERALLPQMAIFVATFVALAFVNVLGYAFLAARARALVESPRALGRINRAGAVLLIGLAASAVALDLAR